MTTPWCARARQSADSVTRLSSFAHLSTTADVAALSICQYRYSDQVNSAFAHLRTAVARSADGTARRQDGSVRSHFMTDDSRPLADCTPSSGLCVSACMSVSLLESCHCVRACVVAAAQSASVDRGCESRDFHPPNWASSRHRSAGKF